MAMMRSVLFWVAAAAAAVSTSGGHWRFTVVALSLQTSSAAPSSSAQARSFSKSATATAATTSRRRAIGWIASTMTATVVSLEGGSSLCRAAEPVDRFNVEDFLKTGMVMNPMGVSGQAGAS
jgi:hypothetical protein